MNDILAAFLNAGIVGSALTVAVWLALSIAPRRALNAATRYAVWWIALVAVIALPVFYLPHHEQPTPEPISSAQPFVTSDPSPVSEVQDSHVVVDAPAPSRLPSVPVEFNMGAWPTAIFVVWAIAALLMILRLSVSYALLERRKLRSRLAENLTRWPVRVLISPDIASPMAAGLFRPAILLPERLLAELDEEELDQIGVHEAAHLMRHDDIALLFQRIIEALFVLHPVVRWITRQIDLEREIACDDFVIAQTGRARPYASCLTRVVEIAGGGRSSIVAAAATAERSHLARRIEMLLDKTRHKGTRLLKTRLGFAAAALLALALVAVKTPAIIAFASVQHESYSDQPPIPPTPPDPPAAPLASEAPAPPPVPDAPIAPLPPEPPTAPEPPAPPAPPEPPPPPQSESHSNRTITSSSKNGLHSTEMRMRGDVKFSDDETDVVAISPGGFFSYEESYAFSGRRYLVSADSSGQLTRRYTVEGHDKPLDADGKAWLRAALPDLLRESGINAPERVRRILKQGGAPAVLAEIAKIHSDGSKAAHIRELVPIGSLTTDQYQSVLRLVRGINSDGEKASVLIFLDLYTLKDNLRDHTFEALRTIHSDGEKHRVLTQFITHDPSRPTLLLAARATVEINSDGEKAAVLVGMSSHLRGNDELRRPYFRAVESINSDGEKARVLVSALSSAGENHDTLLEAIRVAPLINSDGEKARVLIHAQGYWKDDDAMRRAYFESTRSVQSDGEKARVLTSLVGHGVSDQTLIDAARCAKSINSDGEKARVLIAIANRANGKPGVRDEVKTIASSIHSDGEYRHVMTALDLRAANRP